MKWREAKWPDKRCETSTSSPLAPGNATSDVRPLQPARAQRDLSSPDADLDAWTAAATLSSTSKEGFVSSASAWILAFALSSALASALAFLALVRGGMVKWREAQKAVVAFRETSLFSRSLFSLDAPSPLATSPLARAPPMR